MLKWCSAALVALVLPALLAVGSVSAPDLAGLIHQGDQAYAQRFSIAADKPEEFFTAYLPLLRQGIQAYQQAVPLLGTLPVQSQAHVYDRLAQLDNELSKLLTKQAEIEPVLLAGKAAAIASMKLHPGFSEKNLVATLKFVDDVAPLSWGANNWGTWLGFHPLQGLSEVGQVQAMYRRAVAVNEGYWGGSPQNSLGSLLAGLGNLRGAKTHFERAIALDPNYLENYVVYVQYFGFSHDLFSGALTGVRQGQEQFVQDKLNFVLSAPIEPTHPLWSWIAKHEAQELLDQFHKFKG